MTQHNSSSIDRGIDAAVINEFQARASATFGPELDRLVAAAAEQMIDGKYADEQWEPRIEHELRSALRRILVMNTPAEESATTLYIAEFGELSSQQGHQQGQQQPTRNGTGKTIREGFGFSFGPGPELRGRSNMRPLSLSLSLSDPSLENAAIAFCTAGIDSALRVVFGETGEDTDQGVESR